MNITFKSTAENKILHNKVNTYSLSTSSSLNRRYSATFRLSTLSSNALIRKYSQTPGLGRKAIDTKGGRTMASCDNRNSFVKLQKQEKLKKIQVLSAIL